MNEQTAVEWTKLAAKALVERARLKMIEQSDIIGHRHMGKKVEMTKEEIKEWLDNWSKLENPSVSDATKIMWEDVAKILSKQLKGDEQ